MTLPTISRRWLKVAGLMSVLAVMAVAVGVVGSNGADAQQQGGFTVTSTLGNFPSSYPKTTGFQISRLTRNGLASNCFFQKAVPLPLLNVGQQHRFDAYTFPNQTQQTSCVTITQSASCAGQVFLVAYRNTFVPSNITLNYLGDSGLSTNNGLAQTFAVAVPPFTNLVIVAHEVTPGTGCSFYQFTISGIPPVQ